MKTEGLLVGGSSGSALSGTLTWFKTEQGQKIAQTEGLNVVIILADGYVKLAMSWLYEINRVCPTSIRNYMSKEWFLNFALSPGPSRVPKSYLQLPN